MEQCCRACDASFVKTGKSFGRYRIDIVASPTTFTKVFPAYDNNETPQNTVQGFICCDCLSILKAKTVPQKGRGSRRSQKRKWNGTPNKPTWTERTSNSQTPVKFRNVSQSPRILHRSTPPNEAPRKKKRKLGNTANHVGFTYDVITYLKAYQYKRAFHKMIQQSERAKTAFLDVACEMLKQERMELKRKPTHFTRQMTLESIDEFDWKEAINSVDAHAHTTVTLLTAMFPSPEKIVGHRVLGSKRAKRPQTLDEAKNTLNIRIGTALGEILFTADPRRSKFLQSCMGVEFWLQGATHKTFATVNRMGITLSVDASRGHVDRIREVHDKEILEKKKAVETYKKEDRRARRLEFLPKNVSYGVCWDNVQIDIKSKHQGLDIKTSFMMWGMTFAIVHRVPSLHLARNDTIPALQVPANALLPGLPELRGLRSYMVTMVLRYLARNFDCLSHLKIDTVVTHMHSALMTQESTVINTGVVKANPSSTEGTITIMEHLYAYVPEDENGDAILITCSGDGLSLERMIHAHIARSNGRLHKHRLDGLVETPQEFHKEIINLQDFMNILFDGRSIATRGTLAQLKADFRHRSLQKEVKNNVQEVWDMLQFATESYVTLCGMKLRGMATIDTLPESFPETEEEQIEWAKSLAAEIVEFCWLAPSEEELMMLQHDLQNNRDAEIGEENPHLVFPFCCYEDKEGETMVRCCSWECRKMWFHLSCIDLEEPPGELEDWYCSNQCRDDATYIYCFCHKRKGGDMIQCSLGEGCLKYEWYHRACIDSDNQDNWYCCDECGLGALHDDPVLNHTKVLMWLGLNAAVRRDAVREGNGAAMLEHWKLDLLNYWALKHPKYFIIAHQFLANVGGFQPEHMRSDLIWNRVGNLKGLPGHNIGQDLINEFLNNDFKEMLKNAHGRYTDTQVDRCAQMGGGFRRRIDRLFTLASLGQYDSRPTFGRRHNYIEDIRTFCEGYQVDCLFDYLPGRELRGLDDFTFETAIRLPQKLCQKLTALSETMDIRRNLHRPAPMN